MKLTRVAIIGLGSIGKRHLNVISEIRPDIEIILVRSGSGEQCVEEKIATQVVYSIDDAIKLGIQAAIVSTPATFHISQSIELAKRNIHMLIEKPLSINLERLTELQKVIISNSLVAMVGYVLRYDPGAIMFKNWIENKITGKIINARIECGSYLPDWRPNQDYRKAVSAISGLGGGVMLELSHEIDYLNWFFGKPIDVQAKITNSKELDIDVEDQAEMFFTASEGFPISLQLDFNRRFPKRQCTVLTSNEELTWNAIKKKLTLKAFNKSEISFEYENETESIYNLQLKKFIDCIENTNKPIVTIQDGIDVMQLIEAARKSSKIESKVLI